MSTHKTTILVVDDDSALLHLLSIILRDAGYDVCGAQDGFAALVAIRNKVPDILLSDLYMPGMSGFELLSVVRRRFPMIPVIAMSSAYSGTNVPVGIAADAFYEKATDLHVLLGIIRGIRYLPDAKSPLCRSSSAPIWLPWKGDGREDASIVLCCTECMRTFSHVCTDSARLFREANCVHCSALICYAFVRTVNAASPGKFPPSSALKTRIDPVDVRFARCS